MSPQPQLDADFLISTARAIALDVAHNQQLYLAPEALPAIDKLVRERVEDLSSSQFDFEGWKRHVRHISMEVSLIYKSRRERQIVDPNELLNTARTITQTYRYYPFDN
jgi:hypothetical protein